MRVLKYEWKVHFTILIVVPILILALLAFNIWSNAQNLYHQSDIREMHLIFEVFWPLVLALGFATILPTERDNGMLELRMSYPRSYTVSLIHKLLLPFTIWVLTGSLAAWFLHNHYIPFGFWSFIQTSLPPALFLGGVAFLMSSLTLNTPVSFIVAIAWWGWELISHCKRSGLLALLPYTTHLKRTAGFIILNRYVVSLVGLGLMALGAWLLYRRPLPTTEE